MNFTLTICNQSPARTNVTRVVLTVADMNGQRHQTEASVSRPSGAFRQVYPNRTTPVMEPLSSVILEHRITEQFRGEAIFSILSPADVNLNSLEAIAYDSTGAYKLSGA